jgi:hypothetical protein
MNKIAMILAWSFHRCTVQSAPIIEWKIEKSIVEIGESCLLKLPEN